MLSLSIVCSQTTAWLASAALAILSLVYFIMTVAFCVRKAMEGPRHSEVNATAEERAPLFE